VFPNQSGKLPVAILSSGEFNAAPVDAAILGFVLARTGVAEPPQVYDVDGQFGSDTVARFNVQDSGIFCDDTEVTLTGATYSGDAFTATDSIDASSCQTGQCHPY